MSRRYARLRAVSPVGPGGRLVVASAGFEASAQDAGERVRQPPLGVVALGPAGTQAVAGGAGARGCAQRGQSAGVQRGQGRGRSARRRAGRCGRAGRRRPSCCRARGWWGWWGWWRRGPCGPCRRCGGAGRRRALRGQPIIPHQHPASALPSQQPNLRSGLRDNHQRPNETAPTPARSHDTPGSGQHPRPPPTARSFASAQRPRATSAHPPAATRRPARRTADPLTLIRRLGGP